MSDESTFVVIHGHRGSRGTHPENLIPSFEEARDCGAQFIELDVHLSRDDQPVVFHDPVISGRLCRDRHGKPVETPIALRDLSLEEIQSYECGSLTLSSFPRQIATPGTWIPSLKEVLQWKVAHAPELRLNVEIKREAAPGHLLPPVETLTERTLSLLQRFGLASSSLVQSFDLEVVRCARRLDSSLRLSCLFEEDADFAQVALAHQAQVAAPHFSLLTADKVRRCQEAGIEVLPWTVNTREQWNRLLEIGVRAIITDYPRELRAYLATIEVQAFA